MKEPFCINCKHFHPAGWGLQVGTLRLPERCLSPMNAPRQDLITGERTPIHDIREFRITSLPNRCGREGQYYVPKNPLEVKNGSES